MTGLALVLLLHGTPTPLELELQDTRAALPSRGWLAPAIGVSVLGGAVLGLGSALLAGPCLGFFSGPSSCSNHLAGAVVAGLGAAALLTGLVSLAVYAYRHVMLGARIEALEDAVRLLGAPPTAAPAIESRLPPAPVFGGYAWTF